MVLNIASTFWQMSSGEISAHEGKLMCCNADSSWGDLNEETRFPSLDLAKINTYHSIKKLCPFKCLRALIADLSPFEKANIFLKEFHSLRGR